MAVLLTPQRRVLAMAASQIGYSRWKDDKQGTKYARETQPVFWPRDFWLLANGISYCDIFVTWVFWKALGEDFVTDGGLPAGASYNTDYRASKGGRVSKPPRPGDVLVFDWNWGTLSTNHVGILEKVLPSGNYQTLEGNTSVGSSGSQSNGGRVARRVRRPDQVRYVIRPQWSKANGSSAPSKPSAPRTEFADVDKTQRWLTALGYDPGPVDGTYGTKTATATKAAQKDLGITPADGRPGPATRTHLEAAVTTLDKISKDLATIKRALEPGIAGKRSDGELASFIRSQRDIIRADVRGVARTLEPGIAGTRTDGEAILALRKFRNDIRADIAAVRGEQAALEKAMQAVAGGQSIDLDAVRDAAREGVAAALKDLEADVSLTLTTDEG